jgi:hypothetical protein
MPKGWFERYSDIYRNINRVEQRLGNILLYIDFLPGCELPVILLKDGSVLVHFSLDGLDYEGLSIEQRESFSYYIRSALEQLPDEGGGFMLSNLLIRDTPKPVPLVENPAAPELIQFVQGKKQESPTTQVSPTRHETGRQSGENVHKIYWRKGRRNIVLRACSEV